MNLAVRYLKQFTKDLPYEPVIREFTINDNIDRVLEKIIFEKPDIVTFSSYIWNISYVKKLAGLIRLVNPAIKILYGGPEVSYDSKQFLEENIGEYVIYGEGEETYREFIECMLDKKSLKGVRGMCYRDGDKVILNPERPQMDMNKLVFAYDEDEDFSNRIAYMEASRGCPFSCSYCLSSTIKGVRFLDFEKVKEYIDFFIRKKARLVKFVDRTFNASEEMTLKIFDYVIRQNTDTCFHFEITADILTKKEIELLKKAPKGRIQLEIGVQTTNDSVLKNIDRYVEFKDIEDKVSSIRQGNNVNQHLDLIAGLPEEDFESFRNSFNDVYSSRPAMLQLGFLKLLKGSKMRAEAEKYGIVYDSEPPYEVLRTDAISYKELRLLKRCDEMVDTYYNSGKFGTILDFLIPKFETAFDFYLSLGNFFNDKDYFIKKLSGVGHYGVFLEFIKDRVKDFNDDDYLTLQEIIKFDYLKYNKKKFMPEFLNRYSIDRANLKNMEKHLENEYGKINFSKAHIELFSIDVPEFIKDRKIVKGRYIIFYNESGKIVKEYEIDKGGAL